MEEAFAAVLNDADVMSVQLNSQWYRWMHQLVTRYVTGLNSELSAGGTSHPLMTAHPAADAAAEMVGGRRLIATALEAMDLDPRPITFIDNFSTATPRSPWGTPRTKPGPDRSDV